MPQPVVQGELIGQIISVQNATVNSYTNVYTLQLPLLTQAICGKVLTVTVTGYSGTISKTTNIFVESCKYFYFLHLIPTLSQFS